MAKMYELLAEIIPIQRALEDASTPELVEKTQEQFPLSAIVPLEEIRELSAESARLAVEADCPDTLEEKAEKARKMARLAELRLMALDKLEGLTRWYRQLQGEKEMMDEEYAELGRRRAAAVSRFEWVKGFIRSSLTVLGVSKHKAGPFTLALQANPVAVECVGQMPEKWLKPPAPREPNRAQILADFTAEVHEETARLCREQGLTADPKHKGKVAAAEIEAWEIVAAKYKAQGVEFKRGTHLRVT